MRWCARCWRPVSPRRCPRRPRRYGSRPEPSGRDAVLLEQRHDLGLATAEFDERLERIAAAATRQNAVEKASRSVAIERAALDESAEGIRRQHLGPLVAVVAGGIAAGKDMREAVRIAVPFRNRHHRHL